MLPLFRHRYFPRAVLALASMTLIGFLSASSRSSSLSIDDIPPKVESYTASLVTSLRSKFDRDDELPRNLFELPSAFDAANDSCERTCKEETENGWSPLINACPKCPGKYSPCNFCCHQGASSLKLRFFGCPGTTTIVFREDINDNVCNYFANDTSVFGNETARYGVRFVDCKCFDDATDPSSSSFGDIGSCTLMDKQFLEHDDFGIAPSYFDICLVSTNNETAANFSHPLPGIIGLKHVPYDNMAFGDDDDDDDYDDDDVSTLVSSSMAVTYFETSCNENGTDSHGSFAYPLFPGYGKFAGTCPYDGFIDFESEYSRLPEDIIFVGEPPSTSFFYRFIDGTSAGFWPSDGDNYNGELFFEPTFATCECRDCDPWPYTPSSTFAPTQSSSEPSLAPATHNTTVIPSSMATPNPIGGGPLPPDFYLASRIPSSGPSVELSVDPSHFPSSSPTTSPSFFFSEIPSGLPSEVPTDEASTTPSTNPSEDPTKPPSDVPTTISPSRMPSKNPSSIPTIHSSTMPSTTGPSASPSIYISLSPTISPTSSFSEGPSESPSKSSLPSFIPSNKPTVSSLPSISTSSKPSEHPSPSPTALPSVATTVFPSSLPSNRPSFIPTISVSKIPSESPSNPLPSDMPSALSSKAPSFFPSNFPTSDPVTYRCPPSSDPTNSNNPGTPSPVASPPTASPTNHPSTDIPTYLPSTMSSTFVPSEDNDTNAGCVEESECVAFAVSYCSNQATGDICIPPSSTEFRRVLEEIIEFHQAAMAELEI